MQGDNPTTKEIVKPDLSQMMPYRPSAICGVGLNAIPGGYFPLPEAVANIMQRLPPPDCFKGPFVEISKLMDNIAMNIPEHPHSLSTLELKTKMRELEDKSKRKRPPPSDDNVTSTSSQNGGPALDLSLIHI